MSDLDLKWLQNNFGLQYIRFFDIGSASIHDILGFKRILPMADFYAFECCHDWRELNVEQSLRDGINYFHHALSDRDGETTFYPCDTYNGEPWPWSGSLCKPRPHEDFTWGVPYTVPCMRLDTFCDLHGVSPDFIHIDVQGAEYKVLSCLGTHRPKCIWAEVNEFDSHYETGVTYADFLTLLQGFGYHSELRQGVDELFVLDGFEVH